MTEININDYNCDNINDYVITDKINLVKETPLQLAINNNCSIDILDILLRKGADINKGKVINEVYQNQCPLSNAINNSMGEPIIKWFLDNNADINHIETSLWYTPLDYLINNKTYTPVDKENIKKLLLKNNAKTFMDIRIPDCR